MKITPSVVRSALDEVIQIKGRRDGVHMIHQIYATIFTYLEWINKAHIPPAEMALMQRDFFQLMRRARHIDQTGFDLKMPPR